MTMAVPTPVKSKVSLPSNPTKVSVDDWATITSSPDVP